MSQIKNIPQRNILRLRNILIWQLAKIFITKSLFKLSYGINMYLTNIDFIKIRELIYSETGIFINDSKFDFLIRRIKSRMKHLEMKTIKDYLRFLSFDSSGKELEDLILLIVNHETYFFREYPQLEFFVEKIIPIIEDEKKNTQALNVLSAGCSTGDEPYTLAIIFKEMLNDYNNWNIRIDAVDISKNAINKAKKGEYNLMSLRDTPYVYRDRYFSKKDDKYFLKDIKNKVNFICSNLYNDDQIINLPYYDIVFLRNVLIYFDYKSGRALLEKLYDKMNHGAFLFLGQAESVARYTNHFNMTRLGNVFTYRK